MLLLGSWSGCVDPSASSAPADPNRLSDRATECLKSALRYTQNPAVRVQAVEALQDGADLQTLPWIRSALLDDHPGVRFAACLAIGQTRDAGAHTGINKCLSDLDPSVRIAAIFAYHRLGRTERTGDLAGFLLTHPDPAVRRNAALVLGLLGERGAVKILAQAMKDADPGVRQHSLEAMARLGNREAKQELAFLANSGVGVEELFAVSALGAARDPELADTFRYKLEKGPHIETRLAAARALGLLGDDSGLRTALSSLRAPRPTGGDPADPAAAQALRIQQLAAAALGGIRRPQALPALRKVMEKSDDPRVQVSAAKAIREIVGPRSENASPFADAVRVQKR